MPYDPETSITFDEVVPSDAVPRALLGTYFAERAAGFPVPGGYRVTSPVDADFTAPAGVFLVARGPDPLGIGGIRTLQPGTMEVKHLFVLPEARGRRLGARLLAELERRARSAGATRLVLDTNRSLAAAAGLYAGAGFERVEAYNDNANATDWYAKRLGGAPVRPVAVPAARCATRTAGAPGRCG